MSILFANNAKSTLSSTITDSATTITVSDGSGFPSPAEGEEFYATMVSGSPENNWEIVKVTARTGNDLTVVRGQEGTSAQGWVAGTKIEMRITAGIMDAIAALPSEGYVSGWTTYTPVWSTSGTSPSLGDGTLKGLWRRAGDSMEIIIRLTFGSTTTPGTGNFQFSIPGGYNMALTQMATDYIGHGLATTSIGNSNLIAYRYPGTENIGALLQSAWMSNTVPSSWTTDNIIAIRVVVPISQWSTSLNLIQDFQEFYSCTGEGSGEGVTAGVNYTPTTPERGATGSIIPAVVISSTTSTTTTNYTFTLDKTLGPTDKVILEFSTNEGGTWLPVSDGGNSVASRYLGNVPVGMRITPGSDGTTINAAFSNAGRVAGTTYGSGAGDWATIHNTPYQWRWRIRVVRNNNYAEAPKASLYDGEVNISGATTASISRYHRCNDSAADYTVTLPPISGNQGRQIAFIMDSGLTKLVTIKGNASEVIDGVNERVMWAGESCVLRVNDAGTKWEKVGGKSIPMMCKLYPSTDLACSSSVSTLANLNTSDPLSVGGMCDTTNKRINIIRGGRYAITGSVRFGTGGNAPSELHVRKNGVGLFTSEAYGYNVADNMTSHSILSVGDYLELYGTQHSGATKDMWRNYTYLTAIELVIW